MTTVITESTDIFHTFTDEQKAKAYSEWREVENDLRTVMVATMEHSGITADNPESIVCDDPDCIRMMLVEVGEYYIGSLCMSDLLTEFLVYSRHEWIDENIYSDLADDAETIEEHDAWAARATLWALSLWEIVDEILIGYLNSLESYNTDIADEYRKAWYLD